MEIRALLQPWRRHAPAADDGGRAHGARGGAGDELQARREEIARMEERALREAESLEVQRADARAAAAGARGPRAQPRAAVRGAEAREARPAARAGADLGPERRAGQAAPGRRRRAGGPPPGRRCGCRRSRRRRKHEAERRARNILSVAMQRLAAPHAERRHDPAGRAAQRRDEGPDHRPRRAQHPRAREAHRRRRDHRRDALGRACSRASTASGARSPASRSSA